MPFPMVTSPMVAKTHGTSKQSKGVHGFYFNIAVNCTFWMKEILMMDHSLRIVSHHATLHEKPPYSTALQSAIVGLGSTQ